LNSHPSGESPTGVTVIKQVFDSMQQFKQRRPSG
jgi:hypothetical protein